MPWEHFTHGADIGIRGIGRTKNEAFEQAGLALTAVVTEPSLVRDAVELSISCEAPDEELLFAEWLNALIYQMDVRKMLFSRFVVTLEPGTLRASVWGELVDRDRHKPAVEPKGATYTALRVCEASDGEWLAQCIVDV
ncbi:MAG TPA: archease [Terriglobia bacterium]|nr:archease [Terriglobia bacterium]